MERCGGADGSTHTWTWKQCGKEATQHLNRNRIIILLTMHRDSSLVTMESGKILMRMLRCVLNDTSVYLFEINFQLKLLFAQRFDKQYYEEIFLNSWRPRKAGTSVQDWTTGRPTSTTTRMMLNTDICLVYDIAGNLPCCTRIGVRYPNGDDTCIDAVAAQKKCPVLSSARSMYEARETVGEMLGGSYPNTNNAPFYSAFTDSWSKATTVGQTNLSSLKQTC